MNANRRGRLFVCGDIHGCLDELLAKLDEIGFDRQADRLYALGDLVDRGPKSGEVVRLLDEPWFNSIMGNHEVMMIAAATKSRKHQPAAGSEWFSEIDDRERAALVERVRRLPVAITLVTPSGRRVGLVHADMPGTDWATFIKGPGSRCRQDYALWSRKRISSAKHGFPLRPIANVDHVFFGHTPLDEPVHVANMSWIDTGCWMTGRLTIEELL